MAKVFKKLAVAAGLAGLAGYIAGVLTAPKAGKETRQDIKDVTRTGFIETEKQLKKALTELSDLIDQVKQRGSDLSGKASKELDSLATAAKQAREKAREVLSAIHEGDAEDKDLRDAVQQANQAVKHLQAYLRK